MLAQVLKNNFLICIMQLKLKQRCIFHFQVGNYFYDRTFARSTSKVLHSKLKALNSEQLDFIGLRNVNLIDDCFFFLADSFVF